MNIYILSSKIKDVSSFNDGVILRENEFSPLVSFFSTHKNILPESVDYIYTKGVLECSKQFRCVIKNIEWMLKPEGVLEVDVFKNPLKRDRYGTRRIDDVRYEISIAFKNNIKLVAQENTNTSHHLRYTKKTNSLSPNDNINRWTFGIVSDGRKNERIMNIIKRIESFKIPEFEIIICGPAPSKELPEYVSILDDSCFYDDIRIPICKKKNAIFNNAKYDNIVLMHDRIMPSLTWFNQIKERGNYFDAFVPCILDEETNTKHVVDSTYYREFEEFHLYPYSPQWTSHLYMDGGIMIVKKSVAIENPLSEYLHWGEKEDVDFAIRAYAKGVYTSIDHSVVVNTMTYRLAGRPVRSKFIQFLHRIFAYPIWRFKILQDRIKFRIYLNK